MVDVGSDFFGEDGFFVDEAPVGFGLSCEFVEEGEAGHVDAFGVGAFDVFFVVFSAVVWGDDCNIMVFECFGEVECVVSGACERVGGEFEGEEEYLEFFHVSIFRR